VLPEEPCDARRRTILPIVTLFVTVLVTVLVTVFGRRPGGRRPVSSHVLGSSPSKEGASKPTTRSQFH
jgi:hypothetical protein